MDNRRFIETDRSDLIHLDAISSHDKRLAVHHLINDSGTVIFKRSLRNWLRHVPSLTLHATDCSTLRTECAVSG